MSSMIGNGMSTPNFSLMLRVQARCENRLSIERPSSSQFIFLKVSAALAKPMNSVVHTGVKSAGCENRISHLPR
jgi:hypothetical protein